MMKNRERSFLYYAFEKAFEEAMITITVKPIGLLVITVKPIGLL